MVCMQLLSMCCPSTSYAGCSGAETCTAKLKAGHTRNIVIAGPQPHWVQSAVVQLVLADGAAVCCNGGTAPRRNCAQTNETMASKPVLSSALRCPSMPMVQRAIHHSQNRLCCPTTQARDAGSS
jgi:hypothetical protein